MSAHIPARGGRCWCVVFPGVLACRLDVAIKHVHSKSASVRPQTAPRPIALTTAITTGACMRLDVKKACLQHTHTHTHFAGCLQLTDTHPWVLYSVITFMTMIFRQKPMRRVTCSPIPTLVKPLKFPLESTYITKVNNYNITIYIGYGL